MDDTQNFETESNTEPQENAGQETQEQTSDNSRHASESAETSADLSKFSRVTYKGKDLPVTELWSGYQRQNALTRQVQQFQEEKKYISNLEADLRKVASNPALAEEFKKVYPAAYHNYLALIKSTGQTFGTNSTTPHNQQSQTQIEKAIDPRFEKVFQTVEELQRERFEEKVQARQIEIDSAFTKYTAKYPLATPGGDESYVLSRAQARVSRGEALSDKDWEKIFKDAHSRNQSAYESHYKTNINKQTAANMRGNESARGGGIPGSAPRGPRTLKEATKIALEDLTSR
jgi:hypothetical protein